jgi:hypothetical protein
MGSTVESQRGSPSPQAGRARQCQRKPSLLSRLILWTATAVVIAAIFFPQVMANAAADLLAR